MNKRILTLSFASVLLFGAGLAHAEGVEIAGSFRLPAGGEPSLQEIALDNIETEEIREAVVDELRQTLPAMVFAAQLAQEAKKDSPGARISTAIGPQDVLENARIFFANSVKRVPHSMSEHAETTVSLTRHFDPALIEVTIQDEQGVTQIWHSGSTGTGTATTLFHADRPFLDNGESAEELPDNGGGVNSGGSETEFGIASPNLGNPGANGFGANNSNRPKSELKLSGLEY